MKYKNLNGNKEGYEFKIEEGPPEFNQMALYLVRIDRRSDERDTALNEGMLTKFYLCTQSLLMNCLPRFTQKGLDKTDAKKIQDDLKAIGVKIQSTENTNSQIKEKNSLKLFEELIDFNLRLENYKFKYDLVFPSKITKTLQEVAEGDY